MSLETKRASYGAEAYDVPGSGLPSPFPRTMGPNCMAYLKDVVDAGLSGNMIGRFEVAFAARSKPESRATSSTRH